MRSGPGVDPATGGARDFLLEYEPALVEEAVLVVIRGQAGEPELRTRRDALYTVADPDAREAGFRALHADWFSRLGLAEAVAERVREQPSIPAGARRGLVVLARSRRDEGADLLVAPGTDGRGEAERTLLLRLRPETFGAPDRLRALLRHELLHVADMLDPGFGYATLRPGSTGGALPDALLRERYRVLWDALIDGRLVRWGWAAPGVESERRREFAAAFPMLDPHAEAVFARVFGGTLGTHAALMAVAGEPETALGGVRHGRHAGERCPVCESPTHVFQPEAERLPAGVHDGIRRSLPGWEPADGLCRQCADLYLVRLPATAREARP